MLTRRPRAFSKRPRLDAVSPLPRLEATPPVTKTCLVRTGRGVSADVAKLAPVVSAGGRWPSVHGVSEYQEPLLSPAASTGKDRKTARCVRLIMLSLGLRSGHADHGRHI